MDDSCAGVPVFDFGIAFHFNTCSPIHVIRRFACAAGLCTDALMTPRSFISHAEDAPDARTAGDGIAVATNPRASVSGDV